MKLNSKELEAWIEHFEKELCIEKDSTGQTYLKGIIKGLKTAAGDTDKLELLEIEYIKCAE